MGKRHNEYEGYNRDVGFDIKQQVDANNNVIYIGRAYPGASIDSEVWSIIKMSYDSNNNMTTLRYAGGTDDFKWAWSNRTNLNYGDI